VSIVPGSFLAVRRLIFEVAAMSLKAPAPSARTYRHPAHIYVPKDGSFLSLNITWNFLPAQIRRGGNKFFASDQYIFLILYPPADIL